MKSENEKKFEKIGRRKAAAVKTIIVLVPVLFIAAILTANSKTKIPAPENAGAGFPAGDAAEIYTRSCARCHGADGRGQTPKGKQTGAKDFTSAKWQPNEARGIRAIANGKGRMPPFKDNLSAAEIKSVWNYVRSFKQ